ncbi:IS256 family transposase, partial [Bifidobacterium sp. SMA15]|nr:IS256 family transposase [Bifidobacterium platyrrhinorum]
RACEWVCYMKSGSPDPASLIRPEHWKPVRPSPVEENTGDDTDAPKYGTGVSWDEFHTHAERRFDY